MGQRSDGKPGVAGWIVGVVCIAAVVAIAVGWSALRRAERAESRIAVLEGVIEQKNQQIVKLQKGTGAPEDTTEVGEPGE